jgi:hypothetical protein
MKKSILPIKAIIWPALAGVTMLLFHVLPYESAWVEKYFSRGFFQLFRKTWDFITGWSPIPLIYLLVLIIVYILFKRIYLLRKSSSTLWYNLRAFLSTFINIVSVLILLFYWTWGFNYKRQNPLSILSSQEATLSVDALFDELDRVTGILLQIRSSLPADLDWSFINLDKTDNYRADLVAVFQHLALPVHGSVKARLLYPKGSLLHFSTAGVYLPFVGEGHIDPGLHPITWPFTMTHEMSHGYGYTGEDLCNFWALLACVNSHDVITQYSGYFSYWRYLRANAYGADQVCYLEYRASLPPILQQDLEEVNAYSNRYPDIMPKLRDLFYDSYLKSHGISDGLQNYSRIIVLAHQWNEKYGSLQLE